MKVLFTAFVGVSLAFGVSAQQPYSFNRTNLTKDIPVLTMPEVDAQALLQEDESNKGKAVPWRFGFKHPVSFNAGNSGVVETLKDGSKLWRLVVKCPGAYSINLVFDKFHLPDGALLYVYSKNKTHVLGPYASHHNTWDKWFGSDIIPGDEIVIEYFEPHYAAFAGELNIETVTHGYRDPFKMDKGFGDSGNCHNNTNCPVASGWQDDKRSVALMLVGGSSFCTGALVGNVTQDGTPYFLTANHCLSVGSVSSYVFRFNYESSQCTPSLNGPTGNTVSGSVLRASNAASDFALLELNSLPNASYNVFYAGWNKQNVVPTAAVGIHHPSGDIKKISFDNAASVTTGYPNPSGTTHWQVDWDNGVTEGGSSGSPLFDQNHRIVGQLHGGPAYCNGPDLRDYYGKFSTSWTGGGTNATRLSNWLDPQGSGVNFINGYYNSPTTNAIDINLLNIQQPVGSKCQGQSIAPVVTVRNDGSNTIASVQVQYTLNGGSPVTQSFTGLGLVTGNTANLTLNAINPGTGNYTFNVTLLNPNGTNDQNPTNNSGASQFSVANGGQVTIEIKTDNYPEETSYIVTNASGDTVLVSDPFPNANTVYTKTVCLGSGCFDFKIFDSFGDGICCTYGSGYYKIMNANGAVLANGSQFTYSQTKQFCINNTSAAEPAADAPVNVYPNPATDALVVDWSVTRPRVTVAMFDAVGRMVMQQRYAYVSSATLDLSPLAAGVYTVRIDGDDASAVRRVAVVR